jgi:CDP-Glycerol:Poly(glycerophosphate) glycerophosphotransferase
VLIFLGALEITVRAVRRESENERGELRLRGALEAYRPEFVVYFASTVGANYQVGMWLPYFVRIGRPFIIVTRTAPMLAQISQLCEEQGVMVPLIYRRTLRSLEEIIVNSMTAAFYVNNAARNTHLVERRELRHVWLNHGDSEKPACFNPVHAIYDLIFAAGQAGVDRYARHGVSIPAEKFKIVGRPQVELITPARGPIATIERPTVLYAPTWQGNFADTRVYSLPVGRQIVEQLLAHGARVIFRAHPFNYRYPDAQKMISDIGAVLDADREVSGRQHLWGPAAEQEMSVEDCFNASDAMVSDVSAVVSDYLHSDKPFAMVSVGRTPQQLLVDAPAARAAYVIKDDLSNLAQTCDDLLGADPLAAVRNETKIYYLGDFPDENYADGFLFAAREVIDAGRRTPIAAAEPYEAQSTKMRAKSV